MFTRKLIVALSSVFILATGAAPALAQSSTETAAAPAPATAGARREAAPPAAPAPRQQRGRQPNPEQVRAAAQALATATNSGCTVAEATLRGENAEKKSVYEATCTTGPGFILMATTPPQAVDCVILSGQADISRSRDPAADVGLQCAMEANKNVLPVVAAYATQAGIQNCTVDQGSSVGKSTNNNVIYEVGCAGSDGYWLEKTAEGWTKTECLKLVSRNATCKYTTPAEQAATVKAWLVGSAGSACDVSEARYMGNNANGSFYEAKCAAGDGLIVRFDTAMAVQQVYPCAEAQRIGGGCTLTVVPAAPEAAPAPAPATQR